MKMLFWNMRGFGARGRRNQLRDYIHDISIDVIYLQETIKSSFSAAELDSIRGSGRFIGNGCLPRVIPVVFW